MAKVKEEEESLHEVSVVVKIDPYVLYIMASVIPAVWKAEAAMRNNLILHS